MRSTWMFISIIFSYSSLVSLSCLVSVSAFSSLEQSCPTYNIFPPVPKSTSQVSVSPTFSHLSNDSILIVFVPYLFLK